MEKIKRYKEFINENTKSITYCVGCDEIDGVYMVDSRKIEDNPLLYCFESYPKTKHTESGVCIYEFSFYVDNDNNKYFVCDDLDHVTDEEAKYYISSNDFTSSMNVDEVVSTSDREDYERWLQS